jgi:hypothetical protein
LHRIAGRVVSHPSLLLFGAPRAETVKELKENARMARIFHWLLSTTDMMRDWRSASALLLSRRAVKYLTKTKYNK